MITLLGVPFDFIGLTYFQTSKDVSIGDLVVCQTEHGTYIGKDEGFQYSFPADS